MLVRLKQDFIGSSAGKVLDVSEVDARTLLERGIADPAGDEALSPVITKAMEAAMTKVSDSVGQIIDTTLKRPGGKLPRYFLQQFLRHHERQFF